MRAHGLAFGEAIEIELFVRRMRVVVRQAQTQQQRICAENFFEIVDDGNRAALTHQYRLAAECGLERAQRRPRPHALGRNQIRLRAMTGLDFEPHRRRTDFFDVPADEFANFRRFLVWHEAAGDFRPRPRRHNRLAAFPLVAARQAVDLECRARAALFGGREAAFAEQFCDAEQFLQVAVLDGQPGELFPFVCRKRRDVVVETRNGHAAAGIAEFEESLRLKPGEPMTQYNLGLALASNDRPGDAIAHFEQAVRLQPDYPDAELSWGVALKLTGRFPEAVPHFERALQLTPESPNAHTLYGRALADAGRLDEAIAQFEQALRADPDYAEAHFNLALALRQAGRLQEAEAHYREAMRLSPNGPPGRN